MSKKKIFGIAVVGVILGSALTLGVAQFMYVTGGDGFCKSCHSMTPMYESYLQDVHGGKNKVGVKAECAACHLPHDNILKYAYKKSVNGIVEGAITLFGDPEHKDWEAHRKNRADFVFDSGCLSCHEDLQSVSAKNQKAFLPHKDYFAKNINKKCVECHENVGHKNLGFHLKKFSDSLKK